MDITSAQLSSQLDNCCDKGVTKFRTSVTITNHQSLPITALVEPKHLKCITVTQDIYCLCPACLLFCYKIHRYGVNRHLETPSVGGQYARSQRIGTIPEYELQPYCGSIAPVFLDLRHYMNKRENYSHNFFPPRFV